MKNFVKYTENKKRNFLIKKRLRQGWTLSSIAEELEISISALSHYCTRHKIDHDRDLRIDYDDIKIQKLMKKKIPLASISEKLGIPYCRLYAHCKKRNFNFITKEQQANNNYYDYSDVLALANKRMTIAEISEKLKIPWSNIYEYCEYHQIDVKKIKYKPRKVGANV